MDDVDTVIGYLKNKPTGATVADARAAITGRPLDPRKLNAYKAWGLVDMEGDKLILTQSGWEIARDPNQKSVVLSGVIDRTRPYRGAIEWAHHQGFDALNLNDLAANWHQNYKDALGTTNETSIKDAVTCFFNLADGAGLGTYVLGRRTSPTRLEVNKARVETFIEAGPSEPPWSGPDLQEQAELPEGTGADDQPIDSSDEPDEAPAAVNPTPPATPGHRQQGDRLRVFIAHGHNMRVVEQVQTMLDLASIDAEVAEEEESTAIPVPNKVLTAMRRSDAGIICVNADESRRHEDGTFYINENVLIEIGAAFVLYDQRVILMWDKRLPVPSNLQGLYRCEFEGEEIGWDAGMKLMKAVSKFRSET